MFKSFCIYYFEIYNFLKRKKIVNELFELFLKIVNFIP